MATLPSPPTLDTDVLIVGAGPVGLLLAYQLRLFSLPRNPYSTCPSDLSSQSKLISVHIIDAYPRPVQQTYGRAVTFWPRSMELLSMLPTPDGTSSLGEDIMQQCYAVRQSVAYDSEGREKEQGAWGFIESIADTRFRFASVLRQKYVEEIFRKRLSEVGVDVKQPHRFDGLVVDEAVEIGEVGRVTASIVETGESGGEQEYKVRCKYIIGCDGSRTKVRGAAGIESVGDRSEEKWVRIDGVLKHTTVGKPSCYGAIESKEYGNVLWIPLDHGATRLGYAFNEEQRKKYGDTMTEEVFVKEAKESIKPLELEYEKIDWASVYSVGQRVAKTFWTKGCVFLAGDSCHTHSSGAGQGMNAGVNDAVNLGWKLASVLIGRAKSGILDSYDKERRPNAEKLIKYDEDISMMVSGRFPKGWKGDVTEDVNVALIRVLREAKGFNTGLTLGYGGNKMIWKVNGETKTGSDLEIPVPALPGFRAPDVKLMTPALWSEIWLQSLMTNKAEFHVVIFLGQGERGRESFRQFKSTVESSFSTLEQIANFVSRAETTEQVSGASHKPQLPIRFITIVPKTVDNGWHELKTDPLGRVYYDADGSAGLRYGAADEGSVVLIRPDGWIGMKLRLDEEAPQSILRYFRGILDMIQ